MSNSTPSVKCPKCETKWSANRVAQYEGDWEQSDMEWIRDKCPKCKFQSKEFEHFPYVD